MMGRVAPGQAAPLLHHHDQGSQGGFNRSSQHLDHGGVYEPTSKVDAAAHCSPTCSPVQPWLPANLVGRLRTIDNRLPNEKGRSLDFSERPRTLCWWWGGTLRQTYVTQRLRTAMKSCGKVRNPAPTANNPTSSARPGAPAKCIRQDASVIPVCGIEPTSATPDRLAWLHSAEPAPGRTACFRSKRRKNASIRSADPWPVSSLAPKR
jgi:hypothetical protein